MASHLVGPMTLLFLVLLSRRALTKMPGRAFAAMIGTGLLVAVGAIALNGRPALAAADDSRGDARLRPKMNDDGELKLVASMPKSTFGQGERIAVRTRFQNASDKSRIIMHTDYFQNHQVMVRDEDGAEPPLTERGQTNRRRFGGPRDRSVPSKLAPGETSVDGVTELDLLYRLKPGRYDAQVVYADFDGPNSFRVVSNTVHFELKQDVKASAGKVELVVNLPSAVFHEGEPIPFSFRFKNRSDVTYALDYVRFSRNHRVIVRDDAGAEPPLTEEGESRLKRFRQREDWKQPSGPRVGPPRLLLPGEDYHFEKFGDLNRLYHLEPGRYEFEVIYDDPLEPIPLHAASKPVPFEVK